jgi:hypothetical protein
MGREARCHARWGQQEGEVTVLIEPPDLIARGAFRARAPLATLSQIRADHGTLRCFAGTEPVELTLGQLAPRWAAALVAPPPTLAKKLGLTAATHVFVSGTIDDEALAEALARAKRTRSTNAADVIVARTDDPAKLDALLTTHAEALARGVPLWVVYVKGKDAPLGETAVRTMLRERGLMDRKVAAVSERLTALQFTRVARATR